MSKQQVSNYSTIMIEDDSTYVQRASLAEYARIMHEDDWYESTKIHSVIERLAALNVNEELYIGDNATFVTRDEYEKPLLFGDDENNIICFRRVA